MYSPGKAFVVYDIRRHVLPTAPSPVTTHFNDWVVGAAITGVAGRGVVSSYGQIARATVGDKAAASC
jgi:hypothetical protein